MLGQLLDARYRLLEVLGGGGFSQTYVAEDTRRPGNPKCVVKHLKPAITEPKFLETARRLFKIEAETLEKLGHHDQIPRLLAYFEENQEFYLVQELIEGHLLCAELVPGRPWTESQVVQLLQEILGILAFVHSHGVIHRDIKPNNIIRRQQENKLVLVDFGTVKQVKVQLDTVQSQMSASVAIGTVGYMPTEQVRGKPRLSSDIYAVGIIGIQALTGLNPQELQEDPNGEIIWQNGAQVSDRLGAVLTKMVRYHFKDRYESATEVLDVLQSLDTSAGYAATQLDSRPRYTPTQAVTSYAGTAPVSTQVPQSGQQLNSGTPVNSSVQPVAPVSHTHSSNLHTGSQTGEHSKLVTLVKSPVGVTLGIAAAIGVVAAFALNWNNDRELQATLEKAKQLVADGNSVEALVEAVKIPSSNPSYVEAKQLIDKSSVDILKQATEIFEDSGELDKAIALAKKIPEQSTGFEEARDKIFEWKKETQANKQHLRVARQAFDENRLQNAIDEANKISYTPFWKKQKDQIIQEAKSKLEAAKPKPSPDSSRTSNNPPQPQQPVYPAAAQPAYTQPQQPVYVQPSQPVYVQPPQPVNPPPAKTANSTKTSQPVNPASESPSGQSETTPEPTESSTTIDNCSAPDSILGQGSDCPQ